MLFVDSLDVTDGSHIDSRSPVQVRRIDRTALECALGRTSSKQPWWKYWLSASQASSSLDIPKRRVLVLLCGPDSYASHPMTSQRVDVRLTEYVVTGWYRRLLDQWDHAGLRVLLVVC